MSHDYWQDHLVNNSMLVLTMDGHFDHLIDIASKENNMRKKRIIEEFTDQHNKRIRVHKLIFLLDIVSDFLDYNLPMYKPNIKKKQSSCISDR